MTEGSITSIPNDPGAVQADPRLVTPVVDPNRPAWLPAKFDNPEAFAKSYGELEKKLGQSKPPEAVPAAPVKGEAAKAPAAAPKEGTLEVTPAAKPEGTQEQAAQEAVAKAGLDWNALRTEVD